MLIRQLLENYERDIEGNKYAYHLSNGETLSFSVDKKDVPHLMGIRKLPLRQVYQKSALAVYEMLRDGRINIGHVAPHKESYKKVTNFTHLVSILHCGDAVKVVRRIGSLNSSYIFYLDHRPDEIIHLGLTQDDSGLWHPESFLVLQRNVTAYIDNQLPVDVLDMTVSPVEAAEDEAYRV